MQELGAGLFDFRVEVTFLVWRPTLAAPSLRHQSEKMSGAKVEAPGMQGFIDS
jgi:hypothetical protein